VIRLSYGRGTAVTNPGAPSVVSTATISLPCSSPVQLMQLGGCRCCCGHVHRLLRGLHDAAGRSGLADTAAGTLITGCSLSVRYTSNIIEGKLVPAGTPHCSKQWQCLTGPAPHAVPTTPLCQLTSNSTQYFILQNPTSQHSERVVACPPLLLLLLL
jgi:hypothetical protein